MTPANLLTYPHRMRVKAWSNGSATATGSGYGVNLTKRDRDQHFDRGWSDVTVQTHGSSAEVNLSPAFWRDCPELRSAHKRHWHIGRYRSRRV